MGRKKDLTLDEALDILELKEKERIPGAEIGRRLGRSPSVIYNVLRSKHPIYKQLAMFTYCVKPCSIDVGRMRNWKERKKSYLKEQMREIDRDLMSSVQLRRWLDGMEWRGDGYSLYLRPNGIWCETGKTVDRKIVERVYDLLTICLQTLHKKAPKEEK